MKYWLLLACIYWVNTLSAQTLDFKTMLRNHPEMVGGEYYRYIFHDTKLTPAPKGYKPFYISHYGRHGSRYHSSTTYMDDAALPLRKADSLGILTPQGKELLANLNTLLAVHTDHLAMLTELGINEQQSIAKRMCQRFPEVFHNKQRDSVLCKSSQYPRCLASMANFMTSLQQHTHPGIIGRMYCGDDIQKIVGAEVNFKPFYAIEKPFEDSLRRVCCKPFNFMQRMFTDTLQANQLVKDPYNWMKSIVNSGSVVDNLNKGSVPSIVSCFTQEELQGLWIARNARFYFLFAMSKNSPESSHILADKVLYDIVCQADKAIVKDNKRVADFRFGHDSVILPTVCVLGLEGLCGRYDAAHVEDLWNCTESICMASNLQIVFYRNKQNNILVKFLYNEQERLLPALTPVTGCYYNWQDVKSHILKSINL